jgi:hypothetical protein
MTQIDATGKGNTYGISVEYIKSIELQSTDLLKRAYTDIEIRKAWPSSFEEAQISLLFYSSQQDAQTYLKTISSFIDKFPNEPDGYLNRASHYVYNWNALNQNKNAILDMAWNDLEKASQYSQDKSRIFYEKAKLILGALETDSTLNYSNWNLQYAEQNIQKAIEINNEPIYHQLKADIDFYNDNYDSAYNEYMIVNQSPIASYTSFYMAAKSKQQTTGYNILKVINLLDSAIAKSSSYDAVGIILENVELKMLVGLYNEAIKDYDKYYILTGGDVNESFYYFREQAKFRANDLEGALSDIDRALLINNENAVYHAEKASVYLRLQDPANAQISVLKSIELDPEFASAYRILAISLIRQEKKTDACIYLEKAKELGDTLVENLITKHCE